MTKFSKRVLAEQNSETVKTIKKVKKNSKYTRKEINGVVHMVLNPLYAFSHNN